MAILSRDEFFNAVHTIVGTNSDESAISFMENMTDTYNDMEQRIRGGSEDWEKRYNELDEAWKQKYKHRFFNGDNTYIPSEPKREDDGVNPLTLTINDLFK